MQRLTLILGGARSGKSRHALDLFAGEPRRFFVATAEPFDEEMSQRIAQHRRERAGAGWQTLEAPLALTEALAAVDGPAVIDCLTLWLNNLMQHGRDVEAATGGLLEALAGHPHPVALVSNEIGLGLVPETPLGRAFRDAQGRLNQRLAAAADRVVLLVAGLPLVLKG
jgi:adenosylcobinamide kinase/adenosylcobinamide-phosphate guanylyltransferase